MEARDSELVAEYMRQRLLDLSTIELDDWALLETKKAEEERGENETGWGILPHLILEKIFQLLTPQQRYYASLTCFQWYQAINFCSTWEELTLHDTTFTRRRYDYGEKTYRYVLDHHRAQEYLSHVGKHLKRLTILPRSFPGLFAHYHFMNHMSTYSERYQRNPEERHSVQLNIKTLRFVFFLDNSGVSGNSESVLYGTGGDILGSVKRLISNLKHLENLELIDLHLEAKEALHLLDEACSLLCEQLMTLTLINCTKDHYSLLHPTCFVNLQVLRMSPQNVGEEMMEMLLNNYSIKELHLIQNSFTGIAYPIQLKTWTLLFNQLRVFLRTFSQIHKEIVWQEGAPVLSVIYDCPFTKFSVSSMITVVDLYSETLQEYGHLGLAKFRSSRKFVNRIDGPLLSFCRRCLNLTTLFVRDRISTSTALLIVTMTPNLVNFNIRRNGLLKKCDFMFHGDLYLDYNFTEWIKLNSRDYEKTRREVCKIMNKNWKPLSDKDFKSICQQRAPY